MTDDSYLVSLLLRVMLLLRVLFSNQRTPGDDALLLRFLVWAFFGQSHEILSEMCTLIDTVGKDIELDISTMDHGLLPWLDLDFLGDRSKLEAWALHFSYYLWLAGVVRQDLCEDCVWTCTCWIKHGYSRRFRSVMRVK